MAKSNIEWTEMTWNPSTGCDKISSGCKNCYAEIMSYRLKAMGMQKYKNGFSLTCHPEDLNVPYKWKKPKMIFVNSMSDLFHEDMPLKFIKQVFNVMNNCQQHIFQVLTKRSGNLVKYFSLLDWTPNIWMGVTVENNNVINRIDHLRKIPAFIKFISFEPLIGQISIVNLNEIDWVIVGGESGNNARPIEQNWILDIKEKCEELDIPFFFKQWGGKNKKKNGNLLLGNKYLQTPKPYEIV